MSELNGRPHPRVFFNVSPANVDHERIGIDVKTIQKLPRIGGIRHLNVVGFVGGELSSVDPTIANSLTLVKSLPEASINRVDVTCRK